MPGAALQPRRSARNPFRGVLAAGLAASVFALGWLLGGLVRPPSALPQDRIVQHPAVPPRPANPLETEAPGEVREVGYLQIAPAGATEETSVRVPILAGPNLDERRLRTRLPSLPGAVRRQWENQGYRVEEHRRLVSLEVDPGHFVAIPVNDVNLDYVGAQSL